MAQFSDPYGVFDVPVDWPRDGRGEPVVDWDAFHEIVFAREARYANGAGASTGTITYTVGKDRAEQKRGGK